MKSLKVGYFGIIFLLLVLVTPVLANQDSISERVPQSGPYNVVLNAKITLHGGSFFTGGGLFGRVVDKSTVVDGVFLPRYTLWDQGAVWWDCHDGVNRYIKIDLGGVYEIYGFIVQADTNDAYNLYYWDLESSTWRLAWHIPKYKYGWGMQTRPNPNSNSVIYYLPEPIVTNALKIEGDMYDSDLYFAVSEVQAFGVPQLTP